MIAISEFSPDARKAGTLTDTLTLDTIKGSGFGSSIGTIYWSNADDGGSSYINPGIDYDYKMWTDTEIRVRVPEDAGTGDFIVENSGGSQATSSSDITIDYNCNWITYDPGSGDERYEPDLIDDNGNGGYTLTYHEDFYGSGSNDTLNRFEDALTDWIDSTQVNFETNATTTNTSFGSNDGENIVGFDNLSAGVLGTSYSSYSGCDAGGCSRVQWYVSDLDLAFQLESQLSGSWYYGSDPSSISSNEYDFQSVALHELGHHHQLGHVINSNDVMHYAMSDGITRRVLSSDNNDGGNYVMSHSTQSTCCGPAPMQELFLPIELLTFNAQKLRNKTVKLKWTTLTEEHNKFFIIKRSQDNNTFEEITRKAGQHRSLTKTNYHFIDEDPNPGVNYYRLKQVDEDGTTHHVGQAQSVFIQGRHLPLQVTPNPFNNEFYLNIQNTRQIQQLVIQDIRGQQVWSKNVNHDNAESPQQSIHCDLSSLEPGVYLLSIFTNTQIVTRKLIKLD
jgi:hypothetical protein